MGVLEADSLMKGRLPMGSADAHGVRGINFETRNCDLELIVFQACHSEVPQSWWLKTAIFISQFWSSKSKLKV